MNRQERDQEPVDPAAAAQAAEWANVLLAVAEAQTEEERATRTHNARAYAAVLCFAGTDDIEAAVRRYYGDAEFHARCQRLAFLLGDLA